MMSNTGLDGVNRFKTGELVLGYKPGQVHGIEWSRTMDQYCWATRDCCENIEISDEEVGVIDEWLREESRKQTIKNAISSLHHVPTENLIEELIKRGGRGLDVEPGENRLTVQSKSATVIIIEKEPAE